MNNTMEFDLSQNSNACTLLISLEIGQQFKTSQMYMYVATYVRTYVDTSLKSYVQNKTHFLHIFMKCDDSCC